MAIYEFEGRKPDVSDQTYVAKSATIIGDVKIGDNCFIAPGARIKGDYGTIIIGVNSNVQENCVIHARPEKKTKIGDWVTIGHGAIIHGANIGDYAVIGMGSIISDDAKVRRWSVVGEGAVVKNGQEIKKEKVAVGIPAKTINSISDEYKKEWKAIKEEYASFSRRYKENLKRLD
ncbi:MAG: gamma carbonic anhydrase family protein [Candidatus Natronoplasma sp.]